MRKPPNRAPRKVWPICFSKGEERVMDILIDHSERYEIPASVSGDALLALENLSDHLRERGRAILRIVRDGQPIAFDNVLTTFQGMPLSALASVEVETESVAQLVREALDELERTVPELPQLCHQLAEVFQGENPTEGYAPFEKMVAIWGVMKERQLQVSAAINIDLDTLSVRGQPMKRLHEDLNRYLVESADALCAEDCVLLGDLLEYELAPKAELEADIVAVLKERVQTAAGQ